MELLPILSSLRQHKITALLVILEIALTCAIVSNAVFLVSQRMQRMSVPSGAVENELEQIQVRSLRTGDDIKARAQQDLALLRQIPGVSQVALVNQVPYGNSSWNAGVKLNKKQKQSTLNATMYMGENLIPTLGLNLVAGRDFNPSEYGDFLDMMGSGKEAPTVIITQAMAHRLWPEQSALGKSIYYGDKPTRVVGIVESLVRPSDRGADAAQWSMILPVRMSRGTFMLRTTPAQRIQVGKQAAAVLKKADPRRIIREPQTWEQVHEQYFQADRAMTGLLLGVIMALLLVTGLGIVGLGSFWVGQRRKQIGIRRAMGATRANILHYFQTENFLLATLGIAFGMILTYGLNLFLMQHYEIPRLPWIYLPIGAVALWVIGQIAVLGPALRASKVPPVVATRSV